MTTDDDVNLKKGEKEEKGGHVNIAFENDPGSVTGKAVSANPEEEDDGPEREAWGSPLEFLMSCISLSVGLGNVWRFPYTAYANGGGAFLIPYLIILTFIGRPIYFLEIALGQFTSFSQVRVWNAVPFFRGIGYGSVIGNVSVVSYYAMLMGLTIFYLFASFQSTLPWAECDEAWINLGSGIIDKPDTVHNELIPKFKCLNDSLGYVYEIDTDEQSNVSVSQLYFENEVLKQKYQIEDGIGYPEWRLVLCLALAWILIWGALIRGVSGSGKVAYFTALFPYAVLLIMFIRGVTLPNAWKGIKYFIEPNWERMLEAKVWYAAVNQCFFSLSTTIGALMMFGSYNSFHHNSYRDAWIVSGMDTLTSLFAGFTVFAVLGNLAGELGVEVEDVARAGAGLTFVSFAQGLGTFEVVPQLFSVLFYLMLLTLGVGSAVSLTQSLIAVVCDQFPDLKRWKVTTGVCCAGFSLGLIYVTPGGFFMQDLVDHFGANFTIFFMAMLEGVAIGWVYGVNSWITDMEFMVKTKLGWYWKICWAGTLPLGLFIILMYALTTEARWTMNGLAYPDSAIAMGWVLSSSGILLIPLLGGLAIRKAEGNTFMQKFKNSLKPNHKWGPKKQRDRREWLEHKAKQS